MLTVLDAGPLYAAIDDRDPDYHRSLEILRRPDLEFVIPALVVAEVCYLIERRRGPRDEAAFLRSLAEMDVEAPAPEDFPRMAELVERDRCFGDRPR